MTNDEVVTLLQEITRHDNREIDESSVRVWTEAARRQHWTFDEALDAVYEHYSAQTTWLMPGHVTQIIRRGRGRNWQE
ncbi:hypothetical protein [Nocardia sp. NPDC004750]